MFSPSELYKQLAQSSSRHIQTQVLVYELDKTTGKYTYTAAYNEANAIISWDITFGQQTGRFNIGKTICKSLEMLTLKDTAITGDSKIKLQVRFVDPADSSNISKISEWRCLGVFYVDSIRISESRQTRKIIAADYMLRLEKSYISKKKYPISMSEMLNEALELAGTTIDDSVTLLSDPMIFISPHRRDENNNKIYYTRRRIIGGVAALMGGNAYFTDNDTLAFFTYSNNPIKINPQNCFKITSSGESHDIEDVIYDYFGNMSADDEDSFGKIYIKTPFFLASHEEKEDTTDAVKDVLVGKNVRQISIEKQGTGFYDIGETVTVDDGSDSFDITVCGIKYSMSRNGFKETIFSVAGSDSEDNYGGYRDSFSGSSGSSSGGDGGGKSASIIYKINKADLNVTSKYQDIFKIKYVAEMNASAIAAVTLSAFVTTSGDITIGFFIDGELQEEFTELEAIGNRIVSITYPFIKTAVGNHTLRVKVKGAATAIFPAARSYLTLIGNAVTEEEFDGNIIIEESIENIVIEDCQEMTIGGFTDALSISTQSQFLYLDDSQGNAFKTSDGSYFLTKNQELGGNPT